MAIVSFSKKFLYIHIPKTGGTSLSYHLSQELSFGDIEIGATQLGEAVNPFYIKKYDISKHSEYQKFISVIGEETLQTFKKFTIVRDPYSRVNSIYFFLRNNFKRWAESDKMLEFDNVNQFIQSDYFYNNNVPDQMLDPQHKWIKIDDPTASQVKIFKIEDLMMDSTELTTYLEIPKFSMTQKNRSLIHGVESNKLDYISKQIINERYDKDFKIFGYKKEFPFSIQDH